MTLSYLEKNKMSHALDHLAESQARKADHKVQLLSALKALGSTASPILFSYSLLSRRSSVVFFFPPFSRS
jgi:hypothetical protein